MKVQAKETPAAIIAPASATLFFGAWSKSSGAVALAMCSLLLMGCGLFVDARAASVASQSSQRPRGPEIISEQIVPVPRVFRALTGCENPNTGISNGDWGVGSDPVYTVVDNTAPAVGAPLYSANAVFWTSRENAPGQSILLAGAFTDATKTVRIAFIPPGTDDWQAVVRRSHKVVPTTQQGTTGLSFIVPSYFPAGVYGFELKDPAAPPLLGLANVPSLNWAIGIPSVTGPGTALKHQVYDCAVEQGGILRLFGKNFSPSQQVILQSSSGVAYSLRPAGLDSNSITVPIPRTLAHGTYNLWIGAAPWSPTSSPPVHITIHAPPARTARHIACSTLVGDGVTDNTILLQSCLDRYAPAAGSNEIAYIAVGAGTFVLTGGVTAQPFEVLVGLSPTLTNFVGQPRGSPPAAWFNAPQYFGLEDLSLQAAATPYLFHSSGISSGDPFTSGHLFFRNISFASTSAVPNGAESVFALAGPDIQVYNSFFAAGSNQVFDIDYGDGAIVSGNHMVVNNLTGLGISDSQNIIFEDNLTYSQNLPGQGNGGHAGGSGLSITRGNSQFGASALSRDIYVGYNIFENMGSGDQQIITNDGDGGSYFGPIASSTARTVTLANDPAWNWMGTTNPQASVMAIIFGTGMGQYSFLENYSGRTINLISPWKVLPDATSVVVIAQYELNMTIAHNAITNTLGASIVLADALESVIEDNILTNSGNGILISAFGAYGGPAGYGPVMNTDVLRNIIAVGSGSFLTPSVNSNIAGIGIQDMPGCLESGLMIRGNVVPAVNTIYNTDGVNGVSANLIEQNQAYWEPTFPTTGFQVQDNKPPQ